jgi:hypothetical protein
VIITIVEFDRVRNPCSLALSALRFYFECDLVVIRSFWGLDILGL